MPYHRPIPDRKDKESGTASGLRMFAEAENLMQIAFVMPSSVFIGWLLGAWAGSKLHQGWMMIAGILLGCASGWCTSSAWLLPLKKRQPAPTA